MSPNLDTIDASKRLVEHDAIPNLSRQRLVYTFVGTAFGDVRTVGIAEQDPYGDTGMRFSARMLRMPVSSARRRPE